MLFSSIYPTIPIKPNISILFSIILIVEAISFSVFSRKRSCHFKSQCGTCNISWKAILPQPKGLPLRASRWEETSALLCDKRKRACNNALGKKNAVSPPTVQLSGLLPHEFVAGRKRICTEAQINHGGRRILMRKLAAQEGPSSIASYTHKRPDDRISP